MNVAQQPQADDGSTAQKGFTLGELLLMLVKQRKTVLITTFAVAAISAAVTLFLPNVYTTTAMIVPSQDDKGLMGSMMAQLGGLAGMAGVPIGAPSTAELYVTMLKSEPVKDQIVDRFKLMQVYDSKLRVDAFNELNENTSVSIGKKDGVISISVSDVDPKRAAEIANAYVTELGRAAAGLNTTGAGQNRIFLEERLSAARMELSRAEEALKNFQGKTKAIAVTDQAKATIEGVALLRAQLAAQEVQLAILQRQFTDSSQEVKGAQASLTNLRIQIERLEGKSGNSSIPSVGSVPQLGQEYIRLMRDFKIQETLVELLTKQYEMAKLSEIKDLSPFQVLQKARVPERKSKPARTKIVLSMTFVGALISMALICFRERLKTTNNSGSAATVISWE